jgi:serine/threonine protein kinase
MANAQVIHCNLKSSSIIISSDKKIKVINFTHGINRNKNKNMNLEFKPSSSQYVAPEI